METKIESIRHSLAHILAAAVVKKYPDVQLAIGPVIEDGFYYDFKFPQPISETDLAPLQKEMQKIISQKLPFSGEEVTPAQAKKMFKDQPFKVELIEEYAKEGKKLTIYRTGDIFTDLCKGGHVENTSEINPDAFKLTHLAGAYWRGDEKNPMLTRIYAVAFASKDELDKHLAMLEEAKKRDHRKLGVELDLFTFSPLVGSGLPMFTPRGALLRQLLADFVWELMKPYGYERVWSPHMAKVDLYKTSGHYDKFSDDIFYVKSKKTEDQFILKPMNCPHHTQIYASKPRSYRDLPLRLSEVATIYRDENTGQLAGLTRVRSITQDDAHLFCRPDQVEREVKNIYEIVTKFYAAFGMPLRVRLSIWDKKQPEKYLGGAELWQSAVDTLEKLLRQLIGDTFEWAVGEAAFYGPKIDFIATDAIGREWQLATIQLDFNQPARFGLEYTDSDGSKKQPIMIHRAISGSLERFIGIIIEHFAGLFPLWLSPVQVRVIPVSEKFEKYGQTVLSVLKAVGIRADLADSNETLGKRIRAAQLEKIPYVLVVGEIEQKNKSIAVRHAKLGDLKEMKLSILLEHLRKEIAERK